MVSFHSNGSGRSCGGVPHWYSRVESQGWSETVEWFQSLNAYHLQRQWENLQQFHFKGKTSRRPTFVYTVEILRLFWVDPMVWIIVFRLSSPAMATFPNGSCSVWFFNAASNSSYISAFRSIFCHQEPSLMVAKQSELLLVSPFLSNVMKLEEDNFLVWKLQILPTLKGHDLEKVIQKSKCICWTKTLVVIGKEDLKILVWRIMVTRITWRSRISFSWSVWDLWFIGLYFNIWLGFLLPLMFRVF